MTGHITDVEIGTVDAASWPEVLDVVALGMRDNPLHVAAFGPVPERRVAGHRRLMAAVTSIKDFSTTIVARDATGAVVGVCGAMPPGGCRPTAAEKLRLMPPVLRTGPRTAARTLAWLGSWGTHDPATPHWHLGPVAVAAELRGQGIGSSLLRVFCARVDAAGAAAYLETDRPENVRLYRRFGFEVCAEADVIGVPNWFMLRPAAGSAR